MSTLYPELIEEDDEATFSSNLFKLYKLDERCGKLEAPSFRILFLKIRKLKCTYLIILIMLHVLYHIII